MGLFYKWFCSVFLLVPLIGQTQIILDNTLTPEELIEDVLISNGVDVFNVSVQGLAATQLTKFTDVNEHFGFDEGIYMTTGQANILNFASTFTSDVIANFGSSDGDLATLINGNVNDIHDAIVLQFSFIPNGDEVSFRYVFASEEYPDYVCSDYNDAFGFFLSGPGINGPYSNNGKNIALIPRSTTPVTINTVNNGFPGPGATNPNCITTNDIFYVNNTVGSFPPITQAKPVVYNAFTTVLTASSAVQCGETYRIKLVISDVVDAFVDSGVFLEANSFNSTNIGLDLQGLAVDVVENETIEGCPLDLLFSRPASEVGDTNIVQLGWSGTATAGTDYTGHVDSLYFLPGDDTLVYTLDVFQDGLAEGSEIIEVQIVSAACGGAGFTFDIGINDPISLSLGMPDTAWLQCNDSLLLDPAVTGGTGNYVYEWTDNGGNVLGTSELLGPLSANDQGSYFVQVHDACSRDTVEGRIELQQIRIRGDAEFMVTPSPPCLGDPLMINNTSSGLNQFEWHIDNVYYSGQEDIVYQPAQAANTIVTLFGEDSTACFLPDSLSTVISVFDSAFALFTTDPEYCTDVAYSLSAVSDPVNVSFAWSSSNGQIGSSQAFQPVFTSPGNYVITLETTTADGCTDIFSDSVMVSDSIEVSTGFTLPAPRFCKNEIFAPTNQSVNATAFAWDVNGVPYSTIETPSFQFTTAGNYTITLVAQSNSLCSTPGSHSESIGVEEVTASWIADTLCQFQPYVFMAADNIHPVSYDWYVDGVLEGASQQFSPVFNDAGNFEVSLIVTSEINCMDTLTNAITVVEQPVSAFSSGPICAGEFTNFYNLSTGDIDSYLWDFDDGTSSMQSEPVHLFHEGGDYSIVLTTFSDHCAASSATKMITGYQLPVIGLPDELNLCGGETYVLEISDSILQFLDSWVWNDTIGTSYFPATTATPQIELFYGIASCNGSKVIEVTEECDIYFPSAFSPNGDGFNDEFNILDENITSFELHVFDRWGTELFTTTELSNGWDGTYGGQDAPLDTYVYIVSGTRIDGRSFKASGGFVLMR